MQYPSVNNGNNMHKASVEGHVHFGVCYCMCLILPIALYERKYVL